MMWEEPRPERIPGKDVAPVVNLVRLLITVALVSGVTLILSNKLWPGFVRTPAVEPPPASEAAPAGPPSSPVMNDRPRNDGLPASPRAAPPPPREQRTMNRGDPGVLQSLANTCRYWTEQNTHGQYSGNQQMACNDMTRYAREFGMQAPTVSGRGPALPTQRSIPEAGPSVHVNQCGQFGHTTIAYRQCRADEQERLNNWCKSLQTQFDRASGPLRDTLRRDAQAVCGEASRYQIVR
jgi:hypothetical protein